MAYTHRQRTVAERFRWGVLLGLLLAGFGAAQEPTEVVGRWSGEIEIPGAPLAVTVTLEAVEGGLGGTIDIPAQGARALPLEGVAAAGAQVRFAIAGVPGAPTFAGQVEGDALRGTFSQAGQTFPFALERAADEEAGAEPAGTGTYRDPQGRFSVPIPTNWRVSEGAEVVTLSDPNGEIRAHVVLVEAEDARAAIRAAWWRVDPDFALEPTLVQEPPSDPGVAETVVASYEDEDAARIYQGIAQRVEGTTYVLLIAGDLAAVGRRGAQITIVATGFEIAGLERADLSEVTPRLLGGELIAELEAFIEDALAEFGVPGAAVAVVQDERVYLNGFGVRERGGDAPVTPDTQLMIGSAGKSLTTLLMATLVDAGEMTWDTPVREVLPEFSVADPEVSETMTLRNLVCACTGVPRRDLELIFNAASLGAEAVVASLRDFEFFTDFGEAFQYSNQLVGTGGYAAAAAAGADYGELFAGYEEALRERVLIPLGMTSTTLSFAAVTSAGRAATPHTATLDGLYEPISLDLERLLRPIAPAGSHWSSARDMARYLQTLLALGVAPDGARVVSEANLRTTWEPQVPVTATTDYGLGWFVEDYRGLTLINHGGNTFGFTSDLAFLPERGLGIVVLTNGQATNAFNEAVRERLFELVFAQEARVAETVAFIAEETRTVLEDLRGTLRELEAASVRPFLGSYQNGALGEVTLALAGDTLTLDAGEFVAELRPIVDGAGEPDGYILSGAPLAGLPVRLEREGGEPVVIVGEGAVTYTFEPVPQ